MHNVDSYFTSAEIVSESMDRALKAGTFRMVRRSSGRTVVFGRSIDGEDEAFAEIGIGEEFIRLA